MVDWGYERFLWYYLFGKQWEKDLILWSFGHSSCPFSWKKIRFYVFNMILRKLVLQVIHFTQIQLIYIQLIAKNLILRVFLYDLEVSIEILRPCLDQNTIRLKLKNRLVKMVIRDVRIVHAWETKLSWLVLWG